jgi:TRAP-type C4-dicarboxylate transport system permease small subunit
MSRQTGGAMALVNRLGRFGGLLGEIATVFMVASISYDVVMRYLFLAPTIWALEVNTFLLMFVCLLPAADALSTGTQIHVTFLTDRLPLAIRDKMERIGDVAGILFCGVMTWKGLAMAWTAYQHNDRMSTSLGTPLVIPYLFIPVGFGLLGLMYAARLAASLGGSSAHQPAAGAADAGPQF